MRWLDFLAQLRVDVRDPNSTTYTDEVIRVRTNAGLDDFAVRTMMFSREFTSLVADGGGTIDGQEWYELPSNIIKVVGMTVSGAPLSLEPETEWFDGRDQDSEALPSVYCVTADRYRLWQIPDAAYDVVIKAVIVPEHVDTTTSLDELALTNSADIMALGDYVRARCWEQVDELERANYFQRRYEKYLAGRMASVARADLPPSLVPVTF